LNSIGVTDINGTGIGMIQITIFRQDERKGRSYTSTGNPIQDGAQFMTTERISVLLVEDDEQDAYLVQRMLIPVSQAEIVVRHVSTRADTLICLAHHHIDVVLLDLGLPDSQGFDTVLRIRASFPGVPVVVLTGLDDEDVGLRAIECGAQDFVSKDIVTGQLLFRAIRFAIARHGQISSYKA
jgi:DNA-binding response OmpR family regulator